jgi:hypothetical protein
LTSPEGLRLLLISASTAGIYQAVIEDAVDTAIQSQEIQATGTCPDCTDFGGNHSRSRDNSDDNPDSDTHAGGD